MTNRRAFRAVLAVVLAVAAGVSPAAAPAAAAERLRPLSEQSQLSEPIDRLGDFDYAVRMEASRALRRADPEVAGPALLAAARGHEDSYVQFRALVLFYGLGLPDTRAVFADALESANDRVRTAAYGFFEYHPDAALAPRLLAALDRETSEFVRPALVRALAAHGGDEAVRERLVAEIDRGESYFRAAVIEALGDHGAAWAVDALLPLAGAPGTLQDDALLALGRIGGPRAAGAIAAARLGAADVLQPFVAAAACLAGADCGPRLQYLVDTLRHGARAGAEGGPRLLRDAATGVAALAARGDRTALDALFDVGLESAAPAPVVLALGTVALRRPGVVLAALQDRGAPAAELLLLRDAFDMLDEDLAEERFCAHLRRAYWGGAEGSTARAVAADALRVLEF